MMTRLMAGFLVLGCVVAEGGVVAHYPFDADFSDASGNGRNGALTDVGVAGNSGVVVGLR